MSDKYTQIAELYATRLASPQKLATIKPELIDLAYDKANEIHNENMQIRLTLGYTFSPKDNDDPENGPLTDSSLIAFELLEEWEKDALMASTDIARKLYLESHKHVGKQISSLLYTIAEDVHNAWAADMIADGWVYGPQNDDEAQTCISLLPFSVLLTTPELKDYTNYAITIARELLCNIVGEIECSSPATNLHKRISDIFLGSV